MFQQLGCLQGVGGPRRLPCRWGCEWAPRLPAPGCSVLGTSPDPPPTSASSTENPPAGPSPRCVVPSHPGLWPKKGRFHEPTQGGLPPARGCPRPLWLPCPLGWATLRAQSWRAELWGQRRVRVWDSCPGAPWGRHRAGRFPGRLSGLGGAARKQLTRGRLPLRDKTELLLVMVHLTCPYLRARPHSLQRADVPHEGPQRRGGAPVRPRPSGDLCCKGSEGTGIGWRGRKRECCPAPLTGGGGGTHSSGQNGCWGPPSPRPCCASSQVLRAGGQGELGPWQCSRLRGRRLVTWLGRDKMQANWAVEAAAPRARLPRLGRVLLHICQPHALGAGRTRTTWPGADMLTG